MIVWDAGTYRNLDEDRSMAEALEAGHARSGSRARSSAAAGRSSARARGAKPQWLLIKRRDEGADARRSPQSTQPESVKTGRTIEQVAEERRVTAAGRAREDERALVEAPPPDAAP